jgi:hypothetical protein
MHTTHRLLVLAATAAVVMVALVVLVEVEVAEVVARLKVAARIRTKVTPFEVQCLWTVGRTNPSWPSRALSRS